VAARSTLAGFPPTHALVVPLAEHHASVFCTVDLVSVLKFADAVAIIRNGSTPTLDRAGVPVNRNESSPRSANERYTVKINVGAITASVGIAPALAST